MKLDPVPVLLALLDHVDAFEESLGDSWPEYRDRLARLGTCLQRGSVPTELEGDLEGLLQALARSRAAATLKQALRQYTEAMGSRTRQAMTGQQDPSRPDATVTIPVFFGTNRAADLSARESVSYGSERADLNLGVARVSVPIQGRRVGQLDVPRWWRLGGANKGEGVVLLEARPRDAAGFLNELRRSVEAADQRDALIFVHGYNMGFVEAARRAAQISVDLKFRGCTLLYSWPSLDNWLGYSVDEAAIEWSTPHLLGFLRLLMAESGAAATHIMAHSMGNRGLARALERLDLAGLPGGSASLGQVIFAAPDLDSSTFRDLAAAFRGRADRFTLYASRNDLPLRISRLLHKYPRAGDAGNDLVVMSGVDTIDASTVDTSLLGHSYYGSKRSILNDISALIGSGAPPDRRFDLIASESPQGRYWVYRE